MSYQRKLSIYICGAHSVGKTTLHENLQKNEEFVKYKFKGQNEIARTWIQTKGYTQEKLLEPEIFSRLQGELLYEQLRSEAAEATDFGDNYCGFLWDRGLLDPFIYAKLYCKQDVCDNMLVIPGLTDALSRWKQNDDVLIFIPKPQREFISSDGVRLESDMSELLNFHDAMTDTLNDLAVPHTVIETANLRERVNIVVDKVKRKWPFLSS